MLDMLKYLSESGVLRVSGWLLIVRSCETQLSTIRQGDGESVNIAVPSSGTRAEAAPRSTATIGAGRKPGGNGEMVLSEWWEVIKFLFTGEGLMLLFLLFVAAGVIFDEAGKEKR